MKLPYSPQLSALAASDILIGTSSWKYPGWLGLVYDEALYRTRGKLSNAKFERECLREYALTFPTVCVDAGYYTFPKSESIRPMCEQVPPNFKFAFKVTDDITLPEFPNLARFGGRAGQRNEHFLDADLFVRAFLVPLEESRRNIGPLIFEFSTFQKAQFEHGREFVEALDKFLARLPAGWEYGIEIRNKGWLKPEYFEVLRRYGVAHVFNNWTRMPTIEDQLALDGSETASFTVARFLTAKGMSYQASVDVFQPYDRLQAPDEASHRGLRTLLAGSLQKRRKCYVYINNRLEGCAPLTIGKAIEAIADELRALSQRQRIIKVLPEAGKWTVWIADDFAPLYGNKDDALDFARLQAAFTKSEIHIFKDDGTIEQILEFVADNGPRSPGHA